jgi:hypothetical protein
MKYTYLIEPSPNGIAPASGFGKPVAPGSAICYRGAIPN